MQYQHTPVLLKEITEFLNTSQGKIFVDCTLGGGGHTSKLKDQNSKIKIIGFDNDKEAIAAAKSRLAKHKNIEYINDNFKNLKKHVKKPVDGILFDLGVSSYQIDEAARGFSLQKDGPLDMRMDQRQKTTAAHIINNYSQEDLHKIFREYGEERFGRRIARFVVDKRKQAEIESTLGLKKIIEDAISTWKKRESVTRIFQSLRIAVNRELESLEVAIPAAIDLLKPGGRIVVIAYHSLEDRISKHSLRKAKQDGILKILTKKPIRAQAAELSSNPRARSAKLRAGEKA